MGQIYYMEGPIQCRNPVYLLKDSNGLEEKEQIWTYSLHLMHLTVLQYEVFIHQASRYSLDTLILEDKGPFLL